MWIRAPVGGFIRNGRWESLMEYTPALPSRNVSTRSIVAPTYGAKGLFPGVVYVSRATLRKVKQVEVYRPV